MLNNDKLFIVYESEFDTDSPRDYMAEPDIILITTSEEKARNKIKEKLKWYIEFRSCYRINMCQDGFEFSDKSTIFGKVGIITESIDD